MITQFAVLFPAVAQPLNQAFLVDVLDAARADTGVEERPLVASLRPAYPTYVCKNKTE